MATHSSILAWRIPKDRGAWQATVSESKKILDKKVIYGKGLFRSLQR